MKHTVLIGLYLLLSCSLKANQRADDAELDSVKAKLERNGVFRVSEIMTVIGKTWNYDYAHHDYILSRFEKILSDSNRKCEMGVLYNQMGKMNHSSVNITKAITGYLRAIAIFRRCADTANLISSIKNLGRFYNSRKKQQQARAYFAQAQALALKHGKYPEIVSTTLDVAKNMGENHQTDSAILLCKNLLTLEELKNDRFRLGLIHMHLGLSYYHARDTLPALNHFEQALSFFGDKSLRFSALSSRHIALLCRVKDPERALRHIRFASRYRVNPLIRQQIYQDLAEVYQSAKIYDSAFFYLKQYIKSNDTIINREHLNKIEELRLKYDSDMKEEQIARLNDLNMQHKKINYLLFCLLGLFVVLGVVVYVYYNKVKDKNKIINTTLENMKVNQQRLVSEIQNKEVLLKEVHHRVKNNLQLMSSIFSIQQRLDPDERINEVLDMGKKRIHSMAYIHNTLYEYKDLNTLDLHVLLNNTTGTLAKLYSTGTKEVLIHYEGKSMFIDTDLYVHIGMVLNELITNSYKHHNEAGYPVMIEICLRENGQKREISYKDNAGGFDVEKMQKPTSIGLFLIKNLVEQQLRGEIHLSLTSQGVAYTLLF